MANILNADNGAISGSAGIKLSSDTSGVLNIQTNGTTAISIAANQVVSFPATVGINFNGQIQFEAGTALIPAISTVADTNTGIYFPAADTIAFTEGGVESMRLTSAGNVGIGTGSPSEKLSINSANTSTNSLLEIRQGDVIQAYVGMGSDNILRLEALARPTGMVARGNNYLFFETNGSERARIDSAGKLFVGQTGTAFGQINTTTLAIYEGNNASDGGVYIYRKSSSPRLGGISSFGSDSGLVFETNAGGVTAERLRLDSVGNLGIGTTSPVSSSGYTLLTLNNATNGGGLVLQNNGTSAYSMSVDGSSVYFDAPTTRPIRIFNNGSETMRLTSDNRVGIGTTSPATRLDVRNTASTTGSIVNIANSSSSAAGNIVPIRFFTGNTFGGLEQCAAIWGINPNAGTNNGGALVFATSANGTATTPVERARIDSSGRFIVANLDYQPRFYVERSGDQTGYNSTSTGDVVILYNSALQNVGSHFSTSTGKFTAPVTGMYIFQASAFSTGGTPFGQGWLVVNGSRQTGTDMVYQGGAPATIFSATWMLYLNANDTVGFHPYNATDTNQTITANVYHTWFKGYLIG